MSEASDHSETTLRHGFSYIIPSQAQNMLLTIQRLNILCRDASF